MAISREKEQVLKIPPYVPQVRIKLPLKYCTKLYLYLWVTLSGFKLGCQILDQLQVATY